MCDGRMDQQMDQQTDGWTDWQNELRSTQLTKRYELQVLKKASDTFAMTLNYQISPLRPSSSDWCCFKHEKHVNQAFNICSTSIVSTTFSIKQEKKNIFSSHRQLKFC